MTEKMKNGKRTLWIRLRRAALTTMTGIILLTLGGLIGALVVSIASRYARPEDALAKYPRQRPLQWHEHPDDQTEVSDFKVAQRIARDDLNAVHYVLLWFEKHGGKMECVGGLLMGEMQDIFGGWQELRYSRGGCSSPPGGDGGVAGFDFWESSVFEFPHYYYFAYTGTTPDHAAIQFVLSDGTAESADPVNGTVGLVIRRETPFQIEKINYLNKDGEILYGAPSF